VAKYLLRKVGLMILLQMIPQKEPEVRKWLENRLQISHNKRRQKE
jgi:hypothetical protein